MERVKTLINKLQEQLNMNVPVDNLLQTVQMLQSELLHIKKTQPSTEQKGPSVHIAPVIAANPGAPEIKQQLPEEKIIEVLKVDDAEIEAELEEIKRNAEVRKSIGTQNKPPLLFDPIDDTPTLAHQVTGKELQPERTVQPKKEVNENINAANDNSVNDKLKQSKMELSDKLQETSIKDLRKGIGVNDRFLFIKELFRGDEVMYERSIKTINGFSIFPEAEYWIKRELKLKLGWSDTNDFVKQFDQLVRRRFS